MLLSNDSYIINNVAVCLSYEDDTRVETILAKGDLIHVAWNKDKVKAEIEGRISKIYVSALKYLEDPTYPTAESTAYIVVDGSGEYAAHTENIPVGKIMSIDVLEQDSTVRNAIGSTADANRIMFMRVHKLENGEEELQYTKDGVNWFTAIGIGKSMYDLAVECGFKGTLEEWLEKTVGPQGPEGPMGPQGPRGDRGINLYELAVEHGYVGTEEQFILDSRVGPAGPMGPKGETGPMGPEGERGPMGPEGLKGPAGPVGPMGPSMYEYAVKHGYMGSLDQYMESLRGPQGLPGTSITYRGEWEPLREYVYGHTRIDLVEYLGEMYMCSETHMSGSGFDNGKFHLLAKRGLPGQDGAEGIQGVQGEQGIQGQQGIQGPMGPEGPAGVSGIDIPLKSGMFRVYVESGHLHVAMNEGEECPLALTMIDGEPHLVYKLATE